MIIRQSNRLEVANAGLNGVFIVFDIATKRTFNLRGAVGDYNHVDCQAETERDWRIIEEITGGNPRDRRWLERQVLVTARNGDIFACALFTVPHEPVLYKNAYNPGPGKNAHFCLHLRTSLAERPAGINNQYQRGHNACLAAERYSSTTIVAIHPQILTLPTAVDYTVEVISGPVNIRTSPDARTGKTDNLTGKQVRNPRRLKIDREQVGPDGNSHGLWGRIADDPEFTGRWICLRLTSIVAIAPVVELPPPLPALLKGDTHLVAPNDTLIRIGVKYAVPWQDIAYANGIHEPYTIVIGTTLRIPDTVPV